MTHATVLTSRCTPGSPSSVDGSTEVVGSDMAGDSEVVVDGGDRDDGSSGVLGIVVPVAGVDGFGSCEGVRSASLGDGSAGGSDGAVRASISFGSKARVVVTPPGWSEGPSSTSIAFQLM